MPATTCVDTVIEVYKGCESVAWQRPTALQVPERACSLCEVFTIPVYEFTCLKCGKPFEIVRPITQFDPKKVTCPSCRNRRVNRRWTSIVAVTAKKS